MLDGDPTVRNSFAFLATKEDAARVLTSAVSEACGVSITPTSDAIGRFAAGVPMPVCDGSTVAGRGVTFAMAAAHCKRYVHAGQLLGHAPPATMPQLMSAAVHRVMPSL